MGSIIYLVCLALFCGAALWRNWLTKKEQMRLLDIVSKLAKDDINHDLEWKWRYDELEKISYNRMFYHFWRPVKWFSKDSQCIKPRGRG